VSPPHLYMHCSRSPPCHSPTQPPTVYRIPARRHPYQDHRDGFTSQFTPGGVAIQSSPRWSPPSPQFTSICGFCNTLGHTVHNCAAAERYVQSGQAIRTPYGGISFLEDPKNSQPDPYNSPTLSDQSDAHLPNDLEKSIQIQIAALERAKALILAKKNGSSSNTQSPVLPSPNPPYNIAMNPSAIPITTEYPRPQGLMQPIYPGDPDYPGDLDYPNSRENVATEDYEPEVITLDFSRYELSEEPYQRPKGPMQPIPMDLDMESQVTDDVSDQLAIPSGTFTQLQDDEEIATTTAPVTGIDEFFGGLSDDIFEYELELTQSSDVTSSSPVESRSTTWYRVDPEVQDTPPSPPPLPPAILLDVPSSLVPGSTTSLSLPSPSLPQALDQRLGPMYQTQSFLRRFITSASLFSGTPKLPWYSRPQLSELAVSRENESFDFGIDAKDPADIAKGSSQSQPGSDKITKLLSPRDNPSKPAEPVEHLSVLAGILADYEELDDTAVASGPSRSPLLPSIALEIETFGPVPLNDLTTLEPPRTTVATPSEEFLQGRKSYLENKSSGCSIPADLSDPPLSSPSPEYSPFTVSISPLTSPVSLASSVYSSDTASPDIELVDCHPEATTAPEPDSETPAGMHITNDAFEEGRPSDENSDEISSSTGTGVPSMSLVKYSAPTNKPFPRPPTLATRRNRDSTVPTNLRQRPGPSLAPTRSCATRPPAFDTVFKSPRVQQFVLLFDNGTSAHPPPPFSRPGQLASGAFETVSLIIATSQILSSVQPPPFDPPAAVIGPYQLPQTRDWSDLTGTPTSSHVLNPCLFPGLTVTLAQRVLPPRLASTRSCRLPYFQRPPVSVFSMFLIRFFSLFANGLFCLVVSHLLMPQASRAVTFSISLAFPVFQLIFVTLLCSLVSRAAYLVILSASHVFFVSQMYFAPLECSRFAFLDSPGHFCYLLYFSFSPFVLAFSTEGNRYSKSQGRAAGHLPPIPRSLATHYSRDSTVLANLCQRPSPSPALSGFHLPVIDATFQVLLASWLLAFFNETSAPPLTTLHHFSQPRQLASGVLGTISLPIATGHLGPFPKSPGLTTCCDQGPTALKTAPNASPEIDMLLTPSFRDPRCRLDPPPALPRSCAAWSPSFDAAFRVPLIHRSVSLFSDGIPDLLPATLPPSSRSRRLALWNVKTLSLSIAARQFLLRFRSSLPDSLVAVIGPRRFRRDRYRLYSVGSTSTCPPHHDNTDVPEYPEVALFPGAPHHSSFITPSSVLDDCFFQNFVVVPTRQVLFRRILLAQPCRLPHIRWWPVFMLSLFVIHFLSLHANDPSCLVLSRFLVSRAVCAVMFVLHLLCILFFSSLTISPKIFLVVFLVFFFQSCFLSVLLSFGLALLFGPAFPFSLAFSFGFFFPLGFALFWARFFDRGRSVFEVPRRGNGSPSSSLQAPGSATCHFSSSYKFPSPTYHPEFHSLVTDLDKSRLRPECNSTGTKSRTNSTGPTLITTQPRLAKRSCHSRNSPKLGSHSLKSSRQLPDKVALFWDFRDYTSRDGLQCPDHGSFLPWSPERIRIFHRSDSDGFLLEPWAPGVEMMMVPVVKGP